MTTEVLSIVMSGCLFLTGTSAAETPREAEGKIMQNETALGEAMIHRDVGTLSSLVADDWTMQSSSGSVGTKAEFLNDVKSGALVVKSFRIHDMHVRVNGQMAYVMAYDDEESSYNGESHAGTYNWMDVWERRGGSWVSVATQLTRVEATKSH
jgi:ketosteroid isomerase-like protein